MQSSVSHAGGMHVHVHVWICACIAKEDPCVVNIHAYTIIPIYKYSLCHIHVRERTHDSACM